MNRSALSGSGNNWSAYGVVTSLFFAWGLITSLIDPLVASVKGIFSLTDFEAQLSASAFFLAYGMFSLPAAALLARQKSGNTILIALAVMLAGCAIMLAAANIGIYALVLLGLFMLASGITALQVAANPLASRLGRPELSHFRLTFAQALNSLGTFIGPYLGALLFLKGMEVRGSLAVSDAVRFDALAGIDRAFFWIGGLLIALVVFFAFSRNLIQRASHSGSVDEPVSVTGMFRDATNSRWAFLGGLAIFLYVGAEVAIGTQMALFLNDRSILNLSLQEAGKLVSLYWGGAMAGRLFGSALLVRFSAPRLLGVAAGVACAICLYIVLFGGVAAGYLALAIGLFNSIMFPVIFTVTLGRSTASAEATSGLLCFSIVGGAIVPPIAGLVSGHAGYAMAFLVPALCYAVLVIFAVTAGKARIRNSPQP